MNKLDEKFLKYWTKRHARGKWRFCLLSALYFSLLISISTELAALTIFKRNNYEFELLKSIFRFVIMFAGGFYFWGVFQWKTNEK